MNRAQVTTFVEVEFVLVLVGGEVEFVFRKNEAFKDRNEKEKPSKESVLKKIFKIVKIGLLS